MAVSKKSNVKKTRGLSKEISKEIRFLGDLLGEVIVELSGRKVFQLEEEIRELAKKFRADEKKGSKALKNRISKLSLHEAEEVALAFTTYFELVNIAEENYRIGILKKRRKQQGKNLAALKESFGEALLELKSHHSNTEIREMIEALCVDLVFTAHPTEVKRRTILNKITRITHLLEQKSDDPKAVRQSIKKEIASLWLTSRSRFRKLKIKDEVQTGLWYFENTLFQCVGEIEDSFNDSLSQVIPHYRIQSPWIRFGSWIGGDRDGHPEVTAEVTTETLRMHRAASARYLQSLIAELSEKLSFSSNREHISPKIVAQLEQWRSKTELARILDEYPKEPYRCYLKILEGLVGELSLDELNQHVASLKASFVSGRGAKIFEGAFGKLENHLKIFGLHTARLDIRQESSVHEKGLSEAFATLGMSGDYEERSESEKVEILRKALDFQFKGKLLDQFRLSENFKTIFEPLLCLKAVDPAARGVFVISMTDAPSDLLEAMVLLRWAGVAIPIVPLLETRRDLKKGGEILDFAFKDPHYKKQLQSFNQTQMVMLGYSDSNKDAGYAASNWEIFCAQDEISELCKKLKIKVSFFHGRGGSISRGGGPAAQTILSQPASLENGEIRITEQGEVLSSRYLRTEIASRVIEQLIYGTLLGMSKRRRKESKVSSEFLEAMHTIADQSCDAYRSLIRETPEMIPYWSAITPIDFIKQLKIGSRPSSRRKTESVDDLRAIPWVFSWLQTRFVLPGWYGLGSGLEANGNLKKLKKMYKSWSFFRNLVDNAQRTLGKTDLPIAQLYSHLFEDAGVARKIFDRIENEHKLTCQWILKITGQKQILDSEKTLQRSIELRNPYVDPLNFIQAEMIRRFRASESEAEKAQILRVIELSISGISAGLRGTG